MYLAILLPLIMTLIGQVERRTFSGNDFVHNNKLPPTIRIAPVEMILNIIDKCPATIINILVLDKG